MRMLDDKIATGQTKQDAVLDRAIDLDWFQAINRRYGIPPSDRGAQAIAITACRDIRTIDQVRPCAVTEARNSDGSLPTTPIDGATRIVDRPAGIVADSTGARFRGL